MLLHARPHKALALFVFLAVARRRSQAAKEAADEKHDLPVDVVAVARQRFFNVLIPPFAEVLHMRVFQ